VIGVHPAEDGGDLLGEGFGFSRHAGHGRSLFHRIRSGRWGETVPGSARDLSRSTLPGVRVRSSESGDDSIGGEENGMGCGGVA
jgi:hypothetical protein